MSFIDNWKGSKSDGRDLRLRRISHHRHHRDARSPPQRFNYEHAGIEWRRRRMDSDDNRMRSRRVSRTPPPDWRVRRNFFDEPLRSHRDNDLDSRGYNNTSRHQYDEVYTRGNTREAGHSPGPSDNNLCYPYSSRTHSRHSHPLLHNVIQLASDTAPAFPPGMTKFEAPSNRLTGQLTVCNTNDQLTGLIKSLGSFPDKSASFAQRPEVMELASLFSAQQEGRFVDHGRLQYLIERVSQIYDKINKSSLILPRETFEWAVNGEGERDNALFSGRRGGGITMGMANGDESSYLPSSGRATDNDHSMRPSAASSNRIVVPIDQQPPTTVSHILENRSRSHDSGGLIKFDPAPEYIPLQGNRQSHHDREEPSRYSRKHTYYEFENKGLNYAQTDGGYSSAYAGLGEGDMAQHNYSSIECDMHGEWGAKEDEDDDELWNMRQGRLKSMSFGKDGVPGNAEDARSEFKEDTSIFPGDKSSLLGYYNQSSLNLSLGQDSIPVLINPANRQYVSTAVSNANKMYDCSSDQLSRSFKDAPHFNVPTDVTHMPEEPIEPEFSEVAEASAATPDSILVFPSNIHKVNTEGKGVVPQVVGEDGKLQFWLTGMHSAELLHLVKFLMALKEKSRVKEMVKSKLETLCLFAPSKYRRNVPPEVVAAMHDDMSFQCHVCGLRFNTSLESDLHMRYHHQQASATLRPFPFQSRRLKRTKLSKLSEWTGVKFSCVDDLLEFQPRSDQLGDDQTPTDAHTPSATTVPNNSTTSDGLNKLQQEVIVLPRTTLHSGSDTDGSPSILDRLPVIMGSRCGDGDWSTLISTPALMALDSVRQQLLGNAACCEEEDDDVEPVDGKKGNCETDTEFTKEVAKKVFEDLDKEIQGIRKNLRLSSSAENFVNRSNSFCNSVVDVSRAVCPICCEQIPVHWDSRAWEWVGGSASKIVCLDTPQQFSATSRHRRNLLSLLSQVVSQKDSNNEPFAACNCTLAHICLRSNRRQRPQGGGTMSQSIIRNFEVANLAFFERTERQKNGLPLFAVCEGESPSFVDEFEEKNKILGGSPGQFMQLLPENASPVHTACLQHISVMKGLSEELYRRFDGNEKGLMNRVDKECMENTEASDYDSMEATNSPRPVEGPKKGQGEADSSQLGVCCLGEVFSKCCVFGSSVSRTKRRF